MPPALKKEWDDSFNQFVKFYGLDANQEKEAKAELDKAEADIARWLTIQAVPGKSKDKQPTDVQAVMTEVEKTYPSGVLKVEETPAQRIAEYRDKVQEYRNMLDKTDAAFNNDVVGHNRLAVKNEAAGMRKSLMADLDKKTADLEGVMGRSADRDAERTKAFRHRRCRCFGGSTGSRPGAWPSSAAVCCWAC